MKHEVGSDRCDAWSSRLSQAFKVALQKALREDGTRHWNDRSVNRIIARLKTFAKWVHKLRPFPLGNPTDKLKGTPTASLLDVERAITSNERRKILDAAGLLLEIGGRSNDRYRFGHLEQRPKHKGYRASRNRAIVYTLIETGMRRSASTKINVSDVDFEKRTIRTEEKGGVEHFYHVSREGLSAIRDYLEHERALDADHFDSVALFLPAATSPGSDGRLSPKMVNDVWNAVCTTAAVTGKTPHSARHAMGRHLMDKTGNVGAVQRQLGHKNAAYSLQYTRIASQELGSVLDDRK